MSWLPGTGCRCVKAAASFHQNVPCFSSLIRAKVKRGEDKYMHNICTNSYLKQTAVFTNQSSSFASKVKGRKYGNKWSDDATLPGSKLQIRWDWNQVKQRSDKTEITRTAIKETVSIYPVHDCFTAKLIFKPKIVFVLTSLIRAIICIVHSSWQEVALHKNINCCWRLSGRTQQPTCSEGRKCSSFMKKINFTWEKPPWNRGEDTNIHFSAHW